jgi:signal peptidase I
MQDNYHQAALDLSEASLTTQGQLRLKVNSHSMVPMLRPGDQVLVQRVPVDILQRGDLIVTRRGNFYLTHRLVAVDELGFHTKGDRNRQADAPIGVQFIVGQVVAVERRGQTRNIRTRFQLYIARLLGWLGWKETVSSSSPGIWLARIISRAILVLSHIWEL